MTKKTARSTVKDVDIGSSTSPEAYARRLEAESAKDRRIAELEASCASKDLVIEKVAQAYNAQTPRIEELTGSLDLAKKDLARAEHDARTATAAKVEAQDKSLRLAAENGRQTEGYERDLRRHLDNLKEWERRTKEAEKALNDSRHHHFEALNKLSFRAQVAVSMLQNATLTETIAQDLVRLLQAESI